MPKNEEMLQGLYQQDMSERRKFLRHQPKFVWQKNRFNLSKSLEIARRIRLLSILSIIVRSVSILEKAVRIPAGLKKPMTVPFWKVIFDEANHLKHICPEEKT